MVNGLSAAQAKSQGFIEEASDADTASVANSEPLFVGESDNESVSSRSGSRSPPDIRDVNGQAPQLNPAANPFEPKPTTTTSTRPNPFQTATTFGKPSGTPIQTNSTPVFGSNSKSTNQAAHNPFESKDTPKFNFFPLENGSKPKEFKDAPSVSGTKEPSNAGFPTSQLSSEPSETSNGAVLSPFAPSIDKKTTFGQPSTIFPPTTTGSEQTKVAAENLSTPSATAVPSKPKSVFDLATASSAPHVFSFGTSPLFGSAERDSKSHDTTSRSLQSSENNNLSVPVPQQKDTAIKLPSSQTLSSPQSTSFNPFPPSNSISKETSLPQAVSPKSTDSNRPSMPTPASQFNSRSSQPFPAFPSSTAPVFQPRLSPLSTKPAQATRTPNSVFEHTTSNSRSFSKSPATKRSDPQPSQEHSSLTTSQLDPKSVALDQLSRSMLLEDNGVIQHFIEFTVGPIIKASIAQFNDELSWKEASQFLLSGFWCGERMLIGNRGVSCSLVS